MRNGPPMGRQIIPVASRSCSRKTPGVIEASIRRGVDVHLDARSAHRGEVPILAICHSLAARVVAAHDAVCTDPVCVLVHAEWLGLAAPLGLLQRDRRRLSHPRLTKRG